MQRPTTRILTLAAAVFAIGLGGMAHAEPSETSTKPQEARHGNQDPAARAQRLREKLNLTPAQEPALQAFLSTRKPAGGPSGEKPEKGAWKAQQKQAVTKFRAQLTGDQQARFDQMIRKRAAHHKGKAKAEPVS